ncbi:hypothetical protein METEAL_21030 [Mesoterricola silvestris]|uniref:Radical SAM protein n=1 Tax=Mesoterricola silvestris TaxID=2927979 RepID=A0AA48GN47_9BACT|nr:hypothetical protein METEAL_21030 [Mesoterricola silvestris]
MSSLAPSGAPLNLIRVFPRRTSLTPTDPMAFVGNPPLDGLRPEADEVHVSVAFTWDIPEAQRLAREWGRFYPVVKLGGPAMGSPLESFVPGRYLRKGVTFTTRGCNKKCPWCLVPGREGRLAEVQDFPDGWMVQDNNLLQAGRDHILKVIAMLNRQRRAAYFSGGIQADLVDEWFADQLRGIRVGAVFLAADTAGALRPLEKALGLLSYLGRKKLRCFTLIGFGGETIPQAEARLEKVWSLGGMPFAQLYQPADRYIDYPREWRALSKKWMRPAAMVASHRDPKPIDPGPEAWIA